MSGYDAEQTGVHALKKEKLRQPLWLLGYVLVFPALLFQIAFHVWPIIYSVYISMLDWNLLSGRKRFVGLANYQELLSSFEFWQIVRNTATYSLGTVFFSIAFGLILAISLNERKWFRAAIEGAVFAPYVISFVSISLLWLWMLDPQWGLFNGILSALGLPRLQWLTSSSQALPSLILVSVWRSTGYAMLLCLAGLQSIPRNLYETASVEGASSWTQFRTITLPLLSPTLFFLVIVLTLNTFQAFDIVSIMTRGGPANSTMLWVYHIYKLAFEYFRIGPASASATLLFIVLVVLTAFQFKFSSRRVFYS